MSGKVLGIKQAGITGRALATELGIPYGQEFYWNERFNYVFRYGNTSYIPSGQVQVIYNPANSIRLASDKYRARQRLKDSGIPVPQVFHRDNLHDAHYPIIARPYHHYRGKHFYLIADQFHAIKYLERGYFLQEIIDNETEYRIFVWNDELFETNIKVPEREDGKVQSNLIRNRANGWKFNIIRRRYVPARVKELAILSAQAVNLNFSAIDMCIDKHRNIYVFEINTAPALIDRKIEKLAEKIKSDLDNKGIS